MFEVLYSSGLRLAELVSLDWRYTRQGAYESQSWVQLREHEAIVKGKGGKTRSVPLGSQAIAAVERWLDARNGLLGPDTDIDAGADLFLGPRGKTISPRGVQPQLNKIARTHGLWGKESAVRV